MALNSFTERRLLTIWKDDFEFKWRLFQKQFNGMSSHFNIKGSQYEISNLKNRNVPALTIFFVFVLQVLFLSTYWSIETNLGMDVFILYVFIYLYCKISISIINDFCWILFTCKKKIWLTYLMTQINDSSHEEATCR